MREPVGADGAVEEDRTYVPVLSRKSPCRMASRVLRPGASRSCRGAWLAVGLRHRSAGPSVSGRRSGAPTGSPPAARPHDAPAGHRQAAGGWGVSRLRVTRAAFLCLRWWRTAGVRQSRTLLLCQRALRIRSPSSALSRTRERARLAAHGQQTRRRSDDSTS